MARRSASEAAQPGLYLDPGIYDVLHAPGTAAEVGGLERIAARFVRTRAAVPTWLEPACGTGRYLRVAARRGVRVVGFDVSPRMVEYTGRRIEGGSLFVSGMAGFDRFIRARSVDFAFNPINTIRHVESDGEVLGHLAGMARVLKRGGAYAVGLSLTGYGVEGPTADVWQGERGSVRVQQIIQYEPPRSARVRFEDVHSHLVITRGRGRHRRAEHRDSSYRLRCYSARQWRSLIDRSAMRLVAVVDENAEDVDPGPIGYAIYILRPR